MKRGKQPQTEQIGKQGFEDIASQDHDSGREPQNVDGVGHSRIAGPVFKGAFTFGFADQLSSQDVAKCIANQHAIEKIRVIHVRFLFNAIQSGQKSWMTVLQAESKRGWADSIGLNESQKEEKQSEKHSLPDG